jgi:signal transduction histidine kinase
MLSELDNTIIYEHSKAFSLDEQLRKTILILEAQWSEKEIEFEIELEDIILHGNEHLLQEIWLNLLQNAIKFSYPKGIIKINLYKMGSIAKIEICDNGMGISEKDKEHVFERFYKCDKSRSKEGNGLGLVIVKKIVEISNGNIYFDSELNKGSTFTVELPLQIS